MLEPSNDVGRKAGRGMGGGWAKFMRNSWNGNDKENDGLLSMWLIHPYCFLTLIRL